MMLQNTPSTACVMLAHSSFLWEHKSVCHRWAESNIYINERERDWLLVQQFYADFVTSWIALAKYSTLPVVTPAILHLFATLANKFSLLMRAPTVQKERGTAFRDILPDSTIASHIDVKFICQAIHLFRCQPAIAKHPYLLQITRIIIANHHLTCIK